MIDAKKVQIMTKMAAFEKREEEGALKITRYERLDYVRVEVLKMFLCVSVGYLILLGMLAVYHMEYLLEQAVEIEFSPLLGRIAAGYVGLLLVYGVIGIAAYHVRHKRARRLVKEYDRRLHTLRKYYRKQEQDLQEKGRVVRGQRKR